MSYKERRRLKKEQTLKQQLAAQKEAAQRERQRQEEERRAAWAATDHGRAQLAYEAGEMFFQVQRVISVTKAEVLMMMGAATVSEEADKSAQGSRGGFMSNVLEEAANTVENLPITQTLAVVEQIGWRLEHVGYAYRETYSESRDKFLASGQQIATAGEIVAVYLFRRVEVEAV